MRSFFLLLVLSFSVANSQAQTPGTSEMHRPSAFDNSFAGSLPTLGPARSFEDGRYGFLALFELRVAPGVIKTLDVRQFFATEQLTVEGFMRVKTSMPASAELVHVTWVTPTQGQTGIGN